MAIFVIRSDGFKPNEIVDVTVRAESATRWAGDRYRVEEQPDATAAEAAVVETLTEWLIDNYEKGAHWVYETTDKCRHVVELRERRGDVEAYMASLRRHWELVDDHAADIRNA